MVRVRRATKSWGVWLLVTAGAACGGNAFHVDHDPDPSVGGSGGLSGNGGSAGSVSSSGKAQGGRGGSAGSFSGGEPSSEGGSAGEAGSPATTGGEAGSGTETPPPISKDQLVYWFKADAGVDVTAGRIEEWADQSGNAQHAFQGLSTQRPVLETTEGLPHPVVQLAGDTFLELPPIDAPIDGGLTFFAVAGRTEDTGCGPIVELSNGEEIDDVFFGHAGLPMHFEVAHVWHDSQGEVFSLGAMRQVTFKHSGDAMTARVEMSANGSFVDSTEVPFPARLRRNQNFIGRTLYRNCSWFIGGIGEIILYSRVLDRDEQVAVEKYLHDKWQLPD